MSSPLEVDPDGLRQNYSTNQGGMADARSALPTTNGAGLNDSRLEGALGEHTRKTGDQIDKAKDDLEKGKNQVSRIENADKGGSERVRSTAPIGGPEAMRNLMSAAAPAAAQMAAPSAAPAPMAAPAPAPAPAPPPQMPSQMPMARQTMTPDQMTRLLSGAGITPAMLEKAATSPRSSSSRASRGADPKAVGRAQLDPSEVVCRPIREKMDGYKLDKVMDKALDNNGIPRDEDVRKKWKSMLVFMGMRESSFNVNAVNLTDSNAVGSPREDGHPGQSSRGIWQTIPETFARYHVAGTSNNIYDPTSSASAAVSYILDRYGVEPTAGSKFDQFYAARRRNGYTGY